MKRTNNALAAFLFCFFTHWDAIPYYELIEEKNMIHFPTLTFQKHNKYLQFNFVFIYSLCSYIVRCVLCIPNFVFNYLPQFINIYCYYVNNQRKSHPNGTQTVAKCPPNAQINCQICWGKC